MITDDQLQAEFNRIGAGDALGPCSSIVVTTYGCPEGFCRYYDDHVECHCRSDELLAALRDLPDNYCQKSAFEDNTDFWEAFPVSALPTDD